MVLKPLLVVTKSIHLAIRQVELLLLLLVVTWNTSSWAVAEVAAGTQAAAAGQGALEPEQVSLLLLKPIQLPLEVAAMVQPAKELMAPLVSTLFLAQ